MKKSSPNEMMIVYSLIEGNIDGLSNNKILLGVYDLKDDKKISEMFQNNYNLKVYDTRFDDRSYLMKCDPEENCYILKEYLKKNEISNYTHDFGMYTKLGKIKKINRNDETISIKFSNHSLYINIEGDCCNTVNFYLLDKIENFVNYTILDIEKYIYDESRLNKIRGISNIIKKLEKNNLDIELDYFLNEITFLETDDTFKFLGINRGSGFYGADVNIIIDENE